MIGFKVQHAKNLFFDRARVLEADERATIKNLSKAGAFIRRTAKGLIRAVGKKGTPSKPGSPPKSRTGFLKEFIFFVFEQSKGSVLIGAAKLNQVFVGRSGRPVAGTVPSVLEYGGQIGIIEVFKWRKWQRADLRSKRRNAGLATRIRKVNIAARPYMRPAFEKEAPKFSSIWADTITTKAA